MLLGTDNYHLIYPKKEVLGVAGEPSALGWTAVGKISMENTVEITTPVCVIRITCSSLVK